MKTVQKETADALFQVNERLIKLEARLDVIQAETQKEAIKETQQMVNAVQQGFYDQLRDLSIKVAMLESGKEHALIEDKTSS